MTMMMVNEYESRRNKQILMTGIFFLANKKNGDKDLSFFFLLFLEKSQEKNEWTSSMMLIKRNIFSKKKRNRNYRWLNLAFKTNFFSEIHNSGFHIEVPSSSFNNRTIQKTCQDPIWSMKRKFFPFEKNMEKFLVKNSFRSGCCCLVISIIMMIIMIGILSCCFSPSLPTFFEHKWMNEFFNFLNWFILNDNHHHHHQISHDFKQKKKNQNQPENFPH